MKFLTFWTFFYSLERRFFVLEYRKRHFPSLYCLKNKPGKMAIFGPKAWVNPFAKMSILWLFELLVFIARKVVFFFVLEYCKKHFPGLYCGKKKVGKMAIFGPKVWVNPFGKMSIFRLFELFFLKPRKAFTRSRMSLKTFSWLKLPKKKSWGMAGFGPNPWANRFGKMSILWLFELLVFF